MSKRYYLEVRVSNNNYLAVSSSCIASNDAEAIAYFCNSLKNGDWCEDEADYELAAASANALERGEYEVCADVPEGYTVYATVEM